MKTYRDYQPTGFDARGLCADEYDIGHFLVLLGRNRDSGTLAESNWHNALKQLGGESDVVQVHRFGHWACGWFELILVDSKDEDKVRIAEEIEGCLEEYCVLDDEDYSARQWEAASHSWEHTDIAERVRVCQKYRISVFAARHDLDTVAQLDNTGELISYLGED